MADNLAKRNEPHMPATRFGDPFNMLRTEMDRVFDSFMGGGFPSLSGLRNPPAAGEAMLTPQMDVKENAKAITVETELPGMDEKDINVTIQDGLLTIRGEKKFEHKEKGENYHVMERRYGSFQRALRLPETVDDSKVEAKFEKGILSITLPKRPEAVKAEKKISIKSGK